MDGGLFNRQRPSDRRSTVPNRTEAATHRTPVESPSPVEPHREVSTNRGHDKKKSSNSLKLAVVVGVVVATLGILAWLFVPSPRTSAAGIDGKKYQAVVLTDGQAFFGKLEFLNNDYAKLTNVFYVQAKTGTTTDAEKASDVTSENSKFQLIKRGGEVHGPEDGMLISRTQILFFENLKTDGEVTKLIEQYKP